VVPKGDRIALQNSGRTMRRVPYEEREHFELWSQNSLGYPWFDSFCSSPYWGVSLVKAFQAGGELACYLGEEEKSLSVFFERPVQGGTLILPPDGMWLLGTPLLGSRPRESLAELLQYWKQNPCPNGLRQILISGLYPDHPLLKIRFWEKLRGWEIEPSERMQASLDGGVDGFMSRRSKNFRSRLRRTVKSAADAGLDVEYWPNSCSEDEARNLMTRVLAIESKSWKGLSDLGISGGTMEQFYRLMIPKLGQDGRLRGLFLTHNGQDKAYLFGGIFGSYFRGLQFSFLNVEKLGLGNVCQYHIICRLVDEGCRWYDLGQGMDYKRRWSERHIVSRSFVFQVR
jgi:Acetyltransferase (GNAT) domain